MTNQEVYNKLIKHYVTNEQPRGAKDDGTCVYFSDEKQAYCAAGVVLHELMGEADFGDIAGHDGGLDDLRDNHSDILPSEDEVDYEFLKLMQAAHDGADDGEGVLPYVSSVFIRIPELHKRFNAVALKFGLDVTPIKEQV